MFKVSISVLCVLSCSIALAKSKLSKSSFLKAINHLQNESYFSINSDEAGNVFNPKVNSALPEKSDYKEDLVSLLSRFEKYAVKAVNKKRSQRLPFYSLLSGVSKNDYKEKVGRQKISGIGVRLSGFDMDTSSKPVIEEIIMPSALYDGLRVGDQVLAVNDIDALTLKREGKLLDRIKGQPGTTVKLKVRRGSSDHEVEVMRKQLMLQSARIDVVNEGVPVIKFSDSFREGALLEFSNLIETLDKFGSKSVILDLRGVLGGTLYMTRHVLTQFLSKGCVVYKEKFRNKIKVVKTPINGSMRHIRPVFLVDEKTSGAAEILAAYAEDNGFTVIGPKTFGSGYVVSLIELDKDFSFKMVIASILLPGGRELEGGGFKPRLGAASDPVKQALGLLSRKK